MRARTIAELQDTKEEQDTKKKNRSANLLCKKQGK
jgi:hypothetical protein